VIILWDRYNKMTVWSSVAGLHDEVATAKGLIEANAMMGEDIYVSATNDLGDEVFYEELMGRINEHRTFGYGSDQIVSPSG